jgi:Chalcone isomerase-like
MKTAYLFCLAIICTQAAWAQPAASNEAAAAPTVVQPAELRPELSSALPQARRIGTGRLVVWGFQVYDARLWAHPGFSASNFDRAPLALELSYLRGFKAEEVAERSIKEMRRSRPVSDAQATRWTADLLRVLPDVRKGDRVMGVHQPGVGAAFWVNGKNTGEVQDAEFARLFFGIWLSPNTSEPKLREALLAGAAG